MPMPKEPALSAGPLVRLTDPGTKKKTRTYASLLQSPYEKALLEYYANSIRHLLPASVSVSWSPAGEADPTLPRLATREEMDIMTREHRRP